MEITLNKANKIRNVLEATEIPVAVELMTDVKNAVKNLLETGK